MPLLTVIHALLAVFALEAAAMLAAWLLRRRESVLTAWLPYLVSTATGLLLATALLHLLPEAIRSLGNGPPVWYLLAGTLLGLFFVEQMVTVLVHGGEPDEAIVQVQSHGVQAQGHGVQGHGVHGEGHGVHGHGAHSHTHGHHHGRLRPASLVVASSLHSFLDGVSVAAAFVAGARVGWITALAISLHEVPHRVGDFALLLHGGHPPLRAFRLAVLPSLGALVGVAVVAAFGAAGGTAVYWLLPASAGSFLYIACVNLLPELRQQPSRRALLLQTLCLAAGALLAALVTSLPGA
jgi:zinc and cadmium transporter